jgi:protein-S-isoprenylcysteine O-methyltransferase Ste14
VFIGFFLVFLPARILAAAGISTPPHMGFPQAVGAVATAAGSLLAVSCVFTFAFVGKGTPAPFDPPRCLVVRGPYRLLRNPMYMGAGLALAGAALFFESETLGAYAVLFILLAHVFVLAYEEPTLRQTFGEDFEAYCERVGRWLPWR